MTAFVSHTAIDCHDAYALSEWWKPVLGYVDLDGDPNLPGHEECMILDPATGHRLLFIEVPDDALPASVLGQLRPGGDRRRDEEMERLVEHGATLIADRRRPDGSGWFTLADPEDAARVTVRQLLNHTSGLADTGFAAGLMGRQATLAARVASMRDARPASAPGAAFHYFDPNYQILARLVEVASGEPFDAYLQAHVFGPLEMRDTFSALTAEEAAARAPRLAHGHLVVYGVPVAARELSGFLGGSGGVVSTAADMAHYLAMQGDGGRYAGRALLDRADLDLTHRPPPGVASSYGMGWLVGEARGARTIEHNGILSTFYAEAVLLPDSGYGFVLLYDEYALASAALAFPRLKDGLAALLLGQAPPEGGLTVPALGGILAGLTILGAGLALRGLLRLPRWAARVASIPPWRRAAGLVGAFAPGLVLLGLPWLLASGSGRYFGYVMLARAMPDIAIGLGLCAALGALDGAARLLVLWRRR